MFIKASRRLLPHYVFTLVWKQPNNSNYHRLLGQTQSYSNKTKRFLEKTPIFYNFYLILLATYLLCGYLLFLLKTLSNRKFYKFSKNVQYFYIEMYMGQKIKLRLCAKIFIRPTLKLPLRPKHKKFSSFSNSSLRSLDFCSLFVFTM